MRGQLYPEKKEFHPDATTMRRTRCDRERGKREEGRGKERKRKGERNDYALVPSSLRFDSNSAARAREQLLQVVALADDDDDGYDGPIHCFPRPLQTYER